MRASSCTFRSRVRRFVVFGIAFSGVFGGVPDDRSSRPYINNAGVKSVESCFAVFTACCISDSTWSQSCWFFPVYCAIIVFKTRFLFLFWIALRRVGRC